ncbi:MAG: NAD(P)/FAD-dependent oxidoreductase [Alphaproteobacteria bacterium]|nr:NAD(P)/FAD-dependent oxidoreductase [Alphaproteobacteria bacterium]
MRNAAPGSEFDVIVIGGGVNGLICATLLAQAKRRVVVVEALDRLGGACTTIELVAGHRISAFTHLLGPLDAGVMKALRLQRHGLHFTAKQMATIALSPDGRHIVLDGDLRHTAHTLSAHSPADGKAWAPFDSRLRKAVQQLERWVQSPPGGPFDQGNRGGLFAARAGAKAAPTIDAEVAAFLDGSIADLLDSEFETPLLKAALAFDAVLGSALGPRAQGTAFLSVLRAALDGETAEGLVHPQGGAGAFVAALAKAAEAAGVHTRLKSRVAHLLFDNDRLAGVELANGDALYAPSVVSSLDPKTTLLALGAERHLPFGLKRQLKGFRAEGCITKVNLALSAMPNFKGLDRKALRERLIICPSIDYLDRAFAAYEQGSYAPDPAIEITIPSAHDPSLAAPGQHVLSAYVLYTPYTLASGSWDKAKPELIARVGATLRQYAPDLQDLILAADIFTPPDIEKLAGSAGGHWHGGDLTLDQLGPLRPAPGLSRHETPVAGLYLCGAGTHPCGGVTGINGRNAAEAVLATTTVAGVK